MTEQDDREYLLRKIEIQRKMIVSQQKEIAQLNGLLSWIFGLYEWGDVLYPVENKVLTVVGDIQLMRRKLRMEKQAGMIGDIIPSLSSVGKARPKDMRRARKGGAQE